MTARALLLAASIALGVTPAAPSTAADGDLDSSFGTGGKVVTTFADYATANDVAIQSDGKIVVVGTLTPTDFSPPQMIVLRYLPSGMLDETFGGVGYVTADVDSFGGDGRAVAIQSDGKILALGQSAQITHGSSTMFLVRYDSEGVPDPAFGGTGQIDFSPLILSASDLVVRGTDILIGYTESDAMFGLHTKVRNLQQSDGMPNMGFGSSGIVELPLFSIGSAPSMAIRGDGSIIVASSNAVSISPSIVSAFAAGRLTSAGVLDTSFGTGGVSPAFGEPSYVVGGASDVALQSDNRLVLSGTTGGDFTLVGMGADGGLDMTFGTNGLMTDPFASRANALARFDAGTFIAAGGDPQFALARVTSDGELDPTFGTGGRVTTSFGDSFSTVTAIAVLDDGVIVAVGNTGSTTASGIALARYLGTSPTCEPDTDADGVCDTLDECPDGALFASARIIVTNFQQPGCDDRFAFSGVMGVPSTPAINPEATGLRLTVRNGSGTVIIDETLPAGAFDAGTRTGWRTRVGANGAKWKFIRPATAAAVVSRALIRQSAATPGELEIQLKGRAICFAAPISDLPLSASVVITPPQALGGQCGEARFAGQSGPSCAANASGRKITCGS